MMWFFKRKKLMEMQEKKQREAETILAETRRRTENAKKPIKRLTDRFEKNNLILDIKRGLGGHA